VCGSFTNLLYSVCRFREVTGRYEATMLTSEHMCERAPTWRPRALTKEKRASSTSTAILRSHRLPPLFTHVYDRYPEKITVVSFSFKQARFEDMHRPALHWPSEKFEYLGIDPDERTGFDLAGAEEGEHHNAAKLFQDDPYGCFSDLLVQKRLQRNPFLRTGVHEAICPEIRGLLKWCQKELYSGEALPWEENL